MGLTKKKFRKENARHKKKKKRKGGMDSLPLDQFYKNLRDIRRVLPSWAACYIFSVACFFFFFTDMHASRGILTRNKKRERERDVHGNIISRLG